MGNRNLSLKFDLIFKVHLVLDVFNQYDNINIVLQRADGVHNDMERYQNLEESKELMASLI